MKNNVGNNGFTLVEMVIVIIIVSILSVVVISRLSNRNSFNGIIVRDQIISLARSAQQNSLGRANIELTITPNAAGSNVTIANKQGAAVITSTTLSMQSLTLEGDVNTTSSCAGGGSNTISSSAPMRIAFGELGDLGGSGVVGAGYPTAVSSAVRVCINDEVSYSVCVSPTGFAYAGDCDV